MSQSSEWQVTQVGSDAPRPGEAPPADADGGTDGGDDQGLAGGALPDGPTAATSTVVQRADEIVVTEWLGQGTSELAKANPSLVTSGTVREVGGRLESILTLASDIAETILASARQDAAQLLATARKDADDQRAAVAAEIALLRSTVTAEVEALEAAARRQAAELRTAAEHDAERDRATALGELDAALAMKRQVEMQVEEERARAAARAQAVTEMAARGLQSARAAIDSTEHDAAEMISEASRLVAERFALARREFEAAAALLHAHETMAHSPGGMSADGMSAEGISADGISAEGMSAIPAPEDGPPEASSPTEAAASVSDAGQTQEA